MSYRLRFQKIGSSKVYQPNSLSLPHNNDFQHQKMWTQKRQEAKHIQQQKQIDRMLHGIVKERLFGHFISQESRISDQGYYNMEKTMKNMVNPISLSHRRISPIRGLKEYQVIPRKKKFSLHKTIDSAQLSSKKTLSNLPKKNSLTLDSHKQKRPTFFSLNISAYPTFPTHFRDLTNNPTTMLYDIKLTKQHLYKYNLTKKIVSQQMLQKFLYFFNYPGMMNIKQFGKWIENVGNCTNREASFFGFQALDQSHNGFLTISDLFRALQNVPDNPELQKEIYDLMGSIKEIAIEFDKADIDYREIKPTIQQILIRNPQIRLDSLRDLLKQSSKELVPANCVKSTTYHISLLALQHNAQTRQKLKKLEHNNHNNHNNNNNNNNTNKLYGQQNDIKLKQDGLRYQMYADRFGNNRPKLFKMILEMFVGCQIEGWK